MKTLMIDVVNRTYVLLQTLFSEDLGSYLIQTLSQQDLVPRWQDLSEGSRSWAAADGGVRRNISPKRE